MHERMIAFSILAIAICCPAQAGEDRAWGATREGFRLSLSASKDSYRADERIVCTVTLQNVSGEKRAMVLRGVVGQFPISARRSDGKPVHMLNAAHLGATA